MAKHCKKCGAYIARVRNGGVLRKTFSMCKACYAAAKKAAGQLEGK